MANTGRGWLKGCAWGCASTVILGIILAGSAFVAVKHGGEKSISTRRVVEETYATTADYTPPAGDAISAERIERFIAVREELIPYCEKFADHARDLGHIAGYEEMEGEPPARQFISDFGHAVKGVFGLARHLNKYLVVRNQSLLANGMGLGEYTWIYVMAYYAWLGERPEKFVLEEVDYPRIFNDRVAGEVQEMIRRHVGQLEAASGPAVAQSDGSQASALPERLAWWRAELKALAADSTRIPCADGVPASMENSFLPFRDELERLYCRATCEIDLTRTEREGIGFEHD